MGLRPADKIGSFQGVLTTGEENIAILARVRGVITNREHATIGVLSTGEGRISIPIIFLARDYCRNRQRVGDHWSIIHGEGQDCNTYSISSQGLLQEQIENRRSLEYYPRGRVGLQYLFYFQLGTIVGTNREQETIGILSTGEGRIAIHILSRNHVVLTNGEQETIRILSFDSTILHSIIKMVLFSNLYNNPFQNITLSSISLQSIKQSILHDYSLYKRTAQK